MSENMNKKMSDEFLDAAAGEALGANSAAESAAYQQELVSAGPAARRVDRDLRRTVAMLSATSPYMEPSEDQRGRILQATAPVTFRMEDYRKVNRETGRFYKWGFYAAMLFLMAGAWYNLRMQSTLGVANERLGQLTAVVRQRDTAIRSLVNPASVQIRIMDDDRLSGRAAVDEKSQTAVVVVPQGVIPAGGGLQFSISNSEHKTVAYKTIAIEVPPEIFPQANRAELKQALNVKGIQPAPEKVYTATMGK